MSAKRPRVGYIHPATTAEIAHILRFFGDQCIYGLRSVELARGDRGERDDAAVMGRLVVPGRIMLYNQQPSPWLLPRGLSPATAARLQHAGAIIESSGARGQMIVSWPATTLRDYMLFDVLMHEIGHHLLQQYTGKRMARVARTKDHEAFADLFAQQCRSLWEEARDRYMSGGDGP